MVTQRLVIQFSKYGHFLLLFSYSTVQSLTMIYSLLMSTVTLIFFDLRSSVLGLKFGGLWSNLSVAEVRFRGNDCLLGAFSVSVNYYSTISRFPTTD